MTDDDERFAARKAQEAVARAALDAPAPWPSRQAERSSPVQIVDVDRYGRLAVVLAAIERDVYGGAPVLQASLYVAGDEGWRHRGGGGGGSGRDPLDDRAWLGEGAALQLRGSGWVWLDLQAGHAVHYAEVLCSTQVARVVVERPARRREADVTAGPGWVGIVWPEGLWPSVTAFDRIGESVGELSTREFEARASRRPGVRRRRRGMSAEARLESDSE